MPAGFADPGTIAGDGGSAWSVTVLEEAANQRPFGQHSGEFPMQTVLC